MILFKNVTKIYPGNIVALEDINLKINPGEFISIVGQSGAGKTTLLRLLIGEEKVTHGEIFLGSLKINLLRNFAYLRRRIGMVFQDFKLLTTKTVFENIAFALEVSGKPQKEINENVPRLLEIVGLEQKRDRFPNEISGGEKQKVAIARALIHEPEVIVADEPTGNLDMLSSWEIINLLTKINQLGTTVILATHNREIVNSLNRRVVTLDKGRIIRDQEKGKYMI